MPSAKHGGVALWVDVAAAMGHEKLVLETA